ncbi:MAG: GNAT family N-acetyltransferase [Burkholderiales bacterium PBB3]|nr:MAG: GNAT family N-acetyltransferase [Burkholderiales bacterium PBB3]
MHFTRLPNLKHDLVCLRPLEASDMNDWYDYLRLPMVYEHTSWNVQAASELAPYAWSAQEHLASSPLRFAIALRSNNQLVGTAGFHTVSHINRSAELAYDIHPEFWGQGIATAVGAELVTWAHTCTNTLRVQATVLEANERSARVLARLGFAREGLLRSYRLVRGVPGNFYVYSHLATTTAV